MENRTKPSPSLLPLPRGPRGEGEPANASSRFGECRLRSHAPKLDARQLDHHLHDRTPWRTRPFQMSRVVLPLPWGEGGVRGKGLACRLRFSLQPLAPISIPPKIARNQAGIFLVDDSNASSSFVEQPVSAAGRVLPAERVGVRGNGKLQPQAHKDSRNCSKSASPAQNWDSPF